MNTSKTCTGCGRSLPLDDFPRKAASPDGRRTRCRRCTSEAEAAARRPSSVLAFQEACGRVLRRRRADRQTAADARLLAAVDGALERHSSDSFDPLRGAGASEPIGQSEVKNPHEI